MKRYFFVTGLWAIICLPFLRGQCLINTIQSTSYSTGECRGYHFQSIAGSLHQVSGSCGGFWFTPPLTGGDITTGSDQQEIKVLKITPNPAMDYLIVHGLEEGSVHYVEILLSTGQLISKAEVSGNGSWLTISDLMPGIYFIKIFSVDKPSGIQKFIKI
jgi:hypothetical protein